MGDLFSLFWALYIMVLILNLCFGGVILCDTVSEVNDSDVGHLVLNISELGNNCTTDNRDDEFSLGFFLRYKLIFRRKLYWYFSGSNSGKYTNYEEFKQA
jgi:hypothetical protein